jgi:hypothetical protein
MKRLTTLLVAVLALQLLLSAALFWPREDSGEQDALAPLLTVASRVDRVVISDAENTVLLSLGESGWRLPEYHGLPVDRARIERAATQLPDLRRGWPVANSAGAAERFEVAEDAFQRRVEYFQGESPLGTLYIGTSPGFRKVHVRVADNDAIFAVEYNSFDLPAQADQWLDKGLLQVDNVSAVTGLDYSLQLEDGVWRGAGDTPPDADAVDDLINGLANLRVSSAADIATAAILEEMAPPPTLTVVAGDKSYDYRLFEIEDDYYIQRSDIPVHFSLSAFDYDRLNDVNAEYLYPVEEEETPAEEEGDDDAGDTD